MSIIDSRLLFAEDLLVPLGSHNVGDVIDLEDFGAVRDAITNGEPVWWVNKLTDAAVGLGGLRLALKSNSAHDNVHEGQTIVRSATFLNSELVDGTYWNTVMPISSFTLGRFIGVSTFSISDPVTGLRLTSYLTHSPPPHIYHPPIADWR